MDSVIPAPSNERVSRPPPPRRTGRRPRLGELLPQVGAKPKFSTSVRKYKDAGGEMPPWILGKAMASMPDSSAAQHANELNEALGGIFSALELEMCKKYFSIPENRIPQEELKQGGPARERALKEVKCLAEATSPRE
jgi:hypothetical protein